MIEIDSRLRELKTTGLHHRNRRISGPQGPHVLLDGKPVLLLCSNNYLGLADHPRVRAAAADAAMRWGVGAGASRSASGTMTVHRRLEERLAEFENRESALLFGSGFLANIGVIPALARPGDVVFCDELSHASIIDGCCLSRAEVFVYDHLDTEHLAWGLEQAEGRGALIATESIFSMDGDLAPLPEIVELTQRHGVRLLVDESYAIGTVGPGGRGALAELGIEGDADLIVGTLGNALGSYGAFVACDRTMSQYVLNVARTVAHSTAPSPPAVAGAHAALELLEERPLLVARLATAASALRAQLEGEGFDTGGSRSHIASLLIGDPQLALRICESALARGVFAQAVRPPTVPAISSRIRLAVMASHRPEELRAAARILGDSARAAGLDPHTRPEPLEDAEESWEPAPVSEQRPRRRTIWGPPAGRPAAPARPAAPSQPAPPPSVVFDYEAPDTVRVERAA